MKNCPLSILLVLILVSSTSYSQRLSLGAKAAFNNTAVYNDNLYNQVSYVKTHANSFGAQINLMFTKKWGMTTDILLSGQNQKYTLVDSSNTLNGESKFTYLDIPVLIKRKNKIGLYFEFGPMFSYLLTAKETVLNSNGTLNYSNKDFKNDFSTYGLSGVVGIGWDVKLSKRMMINIEGRGGYMFTDVTKHYPDAEVVPMFNSGQISLNSLLSHIDQSGSINYARSTRIFTGINVGLHWVIVPMGLK
ncbi:MAG: porin family protein [Bacteroidota bacterium]